MDDMSAYVAPHRSADGSHLRSHRGLVGLRSGAVVIMLLATPVATWWRTGNLSPDLPNHPTLSYDFGPYNVDPSLERVLGLTSSVLFVVSVVVLVVATFRHSLDARWWLALAPALAAGVVAGASWRLANAGYVGADIGGGPVALFLGACFTVALLYAAAFLGRDLWTGRAAAGWYPMDGTSLRYWDGRAWTDRIVTRQH